MHQGEVTPVYLYVCFIKQRIQMIFSIRKGGHTKPVHVVHIGPLKHLVFKKVNQTPFLFKK
jgi:hypothetical protein